MHTEHYPTPEVLAEAAAAHIVRGLWQAIQQRGRATLVLSGGNTPRATYERLARTPYVTALPWQKVEIFFGDERCVPPDADDSNYRMASESLLNRLPLLPENIHRMAGELPPVQAAAAYEATLRAHLATSPRFDVVLLGLGNDGHTASLFPDTAALHENERLVVANFVPTLSAWRLTMTFTALAGGQEIYFLVAGDAKRAILQAIQKNPLAYPAGRVHAASGQARWLITP
ncbi:MAG: 6-phosphogluconolactonase [Anaerolineales bacterium]